jgi:hypothetical protein
MPPSGPQVNYFPSFQTLSAIRHVDSSANMRLAAGGAQVYKGKKLPVYGLNEVLYRYMPRRTEEI